MQQEQALHLRLLATKWDLASRALLRTVDFGLQTGSTYYEWVYNTDYGPCFKRKEREKTGLRKLKYAIIRGGDLGQVIKYNSVITVLVGTFSASCSPFY